MPPKMRTAPKALSLTQMPPTHPHELDQKYRYFYTRSLSRSDMELGALITLHRSLNQLKQLIITDYGEEVLLDIGTGDIYLNKAFKKKEEATADTNTTNVAASETFQTVLFTNDYLVRNPQRSLKDLYENERFIAAVKDFMERMLLRQKLLNRLARRLLRLSHAMDGKIQKVIPPPIYKYGDERMLQSHEDYKKLLNEFSVKKDMEEEILERIHERMIRQMEQQEEEEGENANDLPPKKEEDEKGEKELSSSSSSSMGAPEAPTSSTGGYDQDVESGMDSANLATSTALAAEGTLSSSGYEEDVESGYAENGLDPLLLNKEHQADLAKLIEYDSEYDKVKTVDLTTGSVKYTSAISAEELEAVTKSQYDFEDKDANIKYNIGSTFTSQASTKEMAMEHKRWMTELLSKIPDQPTFEDLGMKNRVFDLEKRRKMCRNDLDDSIEDTDSPKKKKNKNNVKVEGEDVDMEAEKTSPVEDEKKTTADASFERKKFSLEPVPSFFDQDYHRCLMIHNDLIQSSSTESVEVAAEIANKEYQKAFEASSAVQTKKLALERQKKEVLMYYQSVLLPRYDQTHTMQKNEWMHGKLKFDDDKMNRMCMKMQSEGKMITNELSRAMCMKDSDMVHRALSGAVDRVVARNDPKEFSIGTQFIASKMNAVVDPDQKAVATSLAFAVDTVVNRSERGWISNAVIDQVHGGDQYPPFDKSYSPETSIQVNDNGETLSDFNKRIDAEIEEASKSLLACEQVRSKKWSALLKANADLEKVKPNNKKGARYSYSGTQTAYQAATSVQQSVAAIQMSKAQSQMPYQPVQKPTTARMSYSSKGVSTTSSSNATTTTTTIYKYGDRYSLDNVRARISADGSVVPVSTPKKTSDGLYLRPAGRQRKGMEWDAVNGRWVPGPNM